MKDLMEKISSYNLFNNLLPGAVFSFVVNEVGNIPLIHDNIFISFFMFYFIGVTVSRIGSVIIEPLFKLIKLIKFKPYSEFVMAADNDSKLEILSETNNMYRSFVSLMFSIGIIEAYKLLIEKLEISEIVNGLIIILILLVLYSLSYRKQTNYISKRIETRVGNKEEE